MKKSKAIIFDAGILITFAMNGLLPEFRGLKEKFNGKFIITEQVKYEVIDRPIKTKRFELEALKIQKLFEDKILESPSSLGINGKEIKMRAEQLKETTNSIFLSRKDFIKLVDVGETSCLALSEQLTKKGIQNVIAVDERTIRTLSENPENLKNYLQKKLKTKIKINNQNLKSLGKFKFIRSAELVYIAYKKGVVKLKGKKVLDALLYAVKFKGCAISSDEIEEIKKLG